MEEIKLATPIPGQNLFVVEIKLEEKKADFSVFLEDFLKKIDVSIQCMLNKKNFSITMPVMIVSHEYLYGYDHDNEGMTNDQVLEFESRMQSKIDEVAQKYSMNIAIAPGTVIVKGDKPSNRAYFFTPQSKSNYTDKSKECGKLFDWDGKTIFISICCNWIKYKYDWGRPKADIYFIPSSGYLFLSEKASQIYLGSAHEVSNKPGVVFINSEERFIQTSGVYLVKDSAANQVIYLCQEEKYLKYLDKRSPELVSEGITVSEVQIRGESLQTSMQQTSETSEISQAKTIIKLDTHSGEALNNIPLSDKSVLFPAKMLTGNERSLAEYQHDLRIGLNDQQLTVSLFPTFRDQPFIILTVEINSPLIDYLQKHSTNNPQTIYIQSIPKNPQLKQIIVAQKDINYLHQQLVNYGQQANEDLERLKTFTKNLKTIWQALTKELTKQLSINPLSRFMHYQAIASELNQNELNQDSLVTLYENVQHLLTTKTVKWSLSHVAQRKLQQLDRLLQLAIFFSIPKQDNADLDFLINTIKTFLDDTKKDGKQSHTGLKEIEVFINKPNLSNAQKFLIMQKIAHQRLEGDFFNRLFRSKKVHELYHRLRSTPLIKNQSDNNIGKEVNTAGLNKISVLCS